ncbi:MAG: DUF2508 family protein [Clostridiales bacterium]|jgi:hypothetical protein|nr:YaaL family protein [Eubacteriales bacterium]MDH7567103.1 DUF2508 family protein [Clostridiales bacterium]
MDVNLQRSQEHGRTNKKGMLQNILDLFLGKKADIVPDREQDETRQLIEDIRNARSEWITANMDFEYAKEQELIDYCTYIIKAYQIRYEYFLRLAKEKGIKVYSLED